MKSEVSEPDLALSIKEKRIFIVNRYTVYKIYTFMSEIKIDKYLISEHPKNICFFDI
jgi:hypothetical protein